MYSELDVHTETFIDLLTNELVPAAKHSIKDWELKITRDENARHPTTRFLLKNFEDGRVFETTVITKEVNDEDTTGWIPGPPIHAGVLGDRDVSDADAPTRERRPGTPPEHGWPERTNLGGPLDHDPHQPV